MEQNQNARGASAAAGSVEPPAFPHLSGASSTAPPDRPAPPGDDPDFATDAEATAYWQGVADGIRQAGGIVPPRLAARAAPGKLLVHDDSILPGTGRWQGEALTEGAHPSSIRPLENGAPSTTACGSGPPPRAGEDQDILAFTPVQLRARHDGWTPETQVAFVEALADTGIIRAAAARVNMTEQSVNRLRRRSDARAFDRACRAAEVMGRRRIVSIAYERAIEGTIRRHYFHGELKSEERIYNDRLLITLLGRIPPEPEASPELQAVEQNWDGWMDAIASGREAPAAPEAEVGPEPVPAPEEGMVWEDGDILLTNCPPPEGYDGEEDGRYGDPFYQRTLTAAEADYWEAEGRDSAREQGDRLDTEWFLGRPTFLPSGPEPSTLSAAAAEPERERSEARERSGERPARPADGSSPDEPDRRHAEEAERQVERSEASEACRESLTRPADGSPEGEPDRRHGEVHPEQSRRAGTPQVAKTATEPESEASGEHGQPSESPTPLDTDPDAEF